MATSETIIRKRPIIGRSYASGVSPAQAQSPRGQPASVKPLGVIFVSTKAPFMSVVNRCIKTLDRGPGGARWSSTKVAPLLADRIAKAQNREVDTTRNTDWKTVRQREVLLLATGHAISKLVLISGWFRRQQGYVVTVRTRWASTVDDIFTFEGTDGKEAEAEADADAEGEQADEAMDIDTEKTRILLKSTRQRVMSVLEVAIRLK